MLRFLSEDTRVNSLSAGMHVYRLCMGWTGCQSTAYNPRTAAELHISFDVMQV